MIETLLAARLKMAAVNVYPNVAPTNYKTPCVVYQRLETETFNDLDGYSDQTFVTFQLSISSTTYSDALTLARAVRDNLKSWQDENVRAVSWLNEVSSFDNSTETELHRVMLFFKFYIGD